MNKGLSKLRSELKKNIGIKNAESKNIDQIVVSVSFVPEIVIEACKAALIRQRAIVIETAPAVSKELVAAADFLNIECSSLQEVGEP